MIKRKFYNKSRDKVDLRISTITIVPVRTVLYHIKFCSLPYVFRLVLSRRPMHQRLWISYFLVIIFMIRLISSKILSSVVHPYVTTRFFRGIASVNMNLESAAVASESSEVSNANIVLQRVAAAAQKVGKGPDEVQLVAVSKTKPIEAIKNLYDAGYRHFGENYFQELVEKSQALPSDIQWHFIGHLQSSKSGKIIREVPNLAVVETVDSEKLAGKLNNACETARRNLLDVYIQVDTSGEDTKSGVDHATDELLNLATFIKEQCPLLHVRGLMTIGAPGDLSCFDRLVACREPVATAVGVRPEELVLSMGMSGDFEAAIERGSTSVRVGSTIFGARIYSDNR